MSASAVSGPARSAATTLARGYRELCRTQQVAPSTSDEAASRPPSAEAAETRSRSPSSDRVSLAHHAVFRIRSRRRPSDVGSGEVARCIPAAEIRADGHHRAETTTPDRDDERGRREGTTPPLPISSSGPAGPDVPAPTRCRTALVETDGRDDVRARRLDRVHDLAAESPLGRRSSLPEVWTGRAGADATTVSRPPSRPTSEPRDFGAGKYGHAPPSGPAWRRSTRSPYSAR